MSFEQPYLLIAACALCLPVAVRLAQFIFDSFAQFAEDAGFATRDERIISSLVLLLGGYCGSSIFFVKAIGFSLSVAALVTAAYQVLQLITRWFA